MLYLTLEYNGLEKSFADWGFALHGATCEHVNCRPSTYRLSLPGGSIADAPLFPFEGRIVIRRNRTFSAGAYSGGYTAFVGYRMETIMDGRPEFIGTHYTFANAWYFLEVTGFQQLANLWNQATLVVTYPFTSSLSLFTKTQDVTVGSITYKNQQVKITNGQQIYEILAFMLLYQYTNQPTLFQIGQIDPGVDTPIYQIQEITCAAAIEKCLELSPDCTVIWDYTTVPPTVSVRSRANLLQHNAAVTLALANGVDHKSIRITPRESLVPTSVTIIWRTLISGTIDGVTHQFYSFNLEHWGPGPAWGPRAVVQTFDLVGPTSNTTNVVLRVRAVDCNNPSLQARRDWWASVLPEFADYTRLPLVNFDIPVLPDGTYATVLADGPQPGYADKAPVSLLDFPNQLLDTAIFPWMATNGVPVKSVTVRITGVISYTILEPVKAGNAALPHTAAKNKPFSCRIVITNGLNATYTNLQRSYGEAQPTGVGQALWNALSVLQYEGEHIRLEQSVTPQISMANLLNLSGGNAAWLAMNAQIQKITEDDGTGETTVSIGPARQLSAADLRAVQFYNRLRHLPQIFPS